MEIIDLEDSDGQEKEGVGFVSGSGLLNLRFDVEFNEEGFKKRLPIEISNYKKEKRLANLLPFIFSGGFLLIAAPKLPVGRFFILANGYFGRFVPGRGLIVIIGFEKRN